MPPEAPVKRNPAYRKWSDKETNWSESDTKIIEQALRSNSVSIPASLREYEETLTNLKKS